MRKLKETVIVEGNYDKIRILSAVEANVIVTDGFRIFKNKDMQQMIKRISQKDGVVIFTDSDRAGFMIRNFIKNCTAGERVYHAFIPEIEGKEKRKEKPGKEGLLGVEGVDNEIIIHALESCGAHFKDGKAQKQVDGEKITKLDLYKAGLFGKANSKEQRKAFLKEHGLPQKISPNMLVEVLNTLYKKEEIFS